MAPPPPPAGARVVAQNPFDMSDFDSDVTSLAGATVHSQTSNRITYTNGAALFAVNGNGLTLDPGTHHATGGMVTSFTIYASGVAQFTVSNLAVSFTDFDN